MDRREEHELRYTLQAQKAFIRALDRGERWFRDMYAHYQAHEDQDITDDELAAAEAWLTVGSAAEKLHTQIKKAIATIKNPDSRN